MSEVIATSDSGGRKGRKPERYSLIPAEALAEIARVYAFGSAKYDDHNWRKGFPYSWSWDAMMRHLHAYWSGESTDPESGLPHLAHAAFHINTLLTFDKLELGEDDRP